MNKQEIMEEEIKSTLGITKRIEVEDEPIEIKINRRYLYGDTKLSAKKRMEWFNEESAKSVSALSKKYGSGLNR